MATNLIIPAIINNQLTVNGSATTSAIITNNIGTLAIATDYIFVNGGVGYTNSFVDFATSTWQNTSYCKDARGIVHLVVAAKNGTASTSIFTLPVGYRPATSIIFGAYRGGNIEFIKVFNDGTVVPVSGGVTTGGISGSFCFMAEA